MISVQRGALHRYLVALSARQKLSFIEPGAGFEVHALRPSTRIDWQGKSHFQWIIEITQWVPDYLDAAQTKALDEEMAQANGKKRAELRKIPSDYRFRGGATLLVDAETGRVLYTIRKRLDDQRRRERQRRYMSEIANRSLSATYFRGLHEREPFAALHRF
jgi:hypothetical protein